MLTKFFDIFNDKLIVFYVIRQLGIVKLGI